MLGKREGFYLHVYGGEWGNPGHGVISDKAIIANRQTEKG